LKALKKNNSGSGLAKIFKLILNILCQHLG